MAGDNIYLPYMMEVEDIREETYDVLTLKLHHAMTFRDIGTALGCSEEAAKKRAQRALARLRGLLVSEGDPL